MAFKDFQHIYNEQYSGNCAWCGITLNRVMKNPDKSMGDHWRPRSKGGADSTLPCCPKCNTSRGNKTPMDFIRHCRENRSDIWKRMVKWHHGGKNDLSRMVQRVRDKR